MNFVRQQLEEAMSATAWQNSMPKALVEFCTREDSVLDMLSNKFDIVVYKVAEANRADRPEGLRQVV